MFNSNTNFLSPLSSNTNQNPPPEVIENNLFSANFYKHLLADLKDETLVWKISYELGGEKVYIPKNIKKAHNFNRYGDKFCNWLSSNYGGESIIIPMGPLNEVKRTNHRAKILAGQGYSSNHIVRALRLHHRSAQRIKSQVAKEKQPSFL